MGIPSDVAYFHNLGKNGEENTQANFNDRYDQGLKGRYPMCDDTIVELFSPIIETIEKYMPAENDQHLLEIGCGYGNLALYLKREKGYDITGLEINEKRADIARSNGLDVYNTFSELDGKVFDGAFMHRVIEDPVMREYQATQLVKSLSSRIKVGSFVVVGTRKNNHMHTCSFWNNQFKIEDEITDEDLMIDSLHVGKILVAQRIE